MMSKRKDKTEMKKIIIIALMLMAESVWSGELYRIILGPYHPHEDAEKVICQTGMCTGANNENFRKCVASGGKYKSVKVPVSGYVILECDARGTYFDYEWQEKAKIN